MSSPEALGVPPDYAETNPDEEQLRRADELRALYAASDELADAYRGNIWDAAEQVAGLVFDPAQQQAVRQYAEVLDWSLFGKPGSPLPESVILLQDDTERRAVIDCRRPHLDAVDLLDRQLHRAGVGHVRQRVHQEISERRGAIESTLRDIIRDTAEYKFLAAFDKSPQDPAQHPLNIYWRWVHAGQAEEAAAHKFREASSGFDQRYADTHANPFWQEAQRRERLIDEATMPQPHVRQDQREVFARVRAYLAPYVLDEYVTDQQRQHPDQHISTDDVEIIRADGRTEPRIVPKDRDPESDTDYEDVYDYVERAAIPLSQQLYTGPDELRFIARTFLAEAMGVLLDPWNAGAYAAALKTAVARTIEELDYRFTAMHETGNSLMPGVLGRSSECAMVCRQPTGEALDAQWFKQLDITHGDGWHHAFGHESSLATRHEILHDEQDVIGSAHTYLPVDFRISNRLVVLGSSNETLPTTYPGNEDLTISLWGVELNGRIPIVPGYKAVSYSSRWQTHGYIVDPDGDPYHECDVALEPQAQHELIAQWDDIGLTELAAAARQCEVLTAATMADLIREYTDYYLPDTLTIYDPTNSLARRSVSCNDLAEFSTLVRHGRLQVQASGAAQFLRVCLEQAFGPGCAGIARGLVLSGDSPNITTSQHAQTLFVHDGRQYLLDAAPASDEIGVISTLPVNQTAGTQHNPHIPQFQPGNRESYRNLAAPEHARLTPEEQLQLLRQNHTEYLRVHLDVPTDEALYEYLARLPSHDPARLSFELLIQVTNRSITADTLKTEAGYLRTCLQAPPELRGQLGIGHYSVHFLEAIDFCGWRLRDLYAHLER